MPPPDIASGGSQLDAMSWRALPDARVDCADVVSHAVLPDGQTIFVSVGITPDDEATYSFHGGGEREFRVEAPRRVGAAVPRTRYFDGDLRLRLRAGVQRLRLWAPPGVEAEEKLFSEDPAEVLMGATLVHMGGKSRFCLVECVHVSGEENDYFFFEVKKRMTMSMMRSLKRIPRRICSA
jgi:hypothetical protein